MELVKSKRMFKRFLREIQQEYLNDEHTIYTQERLSSMYDKLVSDEWTLFCLKNKLAKPIAFLLIKPEYGEEHTIVFKNVIVLKQFRGKGYGKKLMFSVEDYVKKQGYTKIVLGARRGREGFYYSCGFVGEGLLQGEVNKFTKKQLEQFLAENGIKNWHYNLFKLETEVHQYYFNENEIKNEKLLEKADKLKIDVRIMFSKNI